MNIPEHLLNQKISVDGNLFKIVKDSNGYIVLDVLSNGDVNFKCSVDVNSITNDHCIFIGRFFGQMISATITFASLEKGIIK